MDEKAKDCISKKLQQVRKKLGYSQKNFAERMSVSQNTMNRFEKGHRLPDLEFLSRLREGFEVDLNWLVQQQEGSINPTPSHTLPIFDETQLALPDRQRSSDKSLSVPDIDAAAYAYRVRDESMAPVTRLGDYVVVQETEAMLGDLVLCRNRTGVVQVRRLSGYDSHTFLTPENSDYQAAELSEGIKVLGRVVTVVKVVPT